MNANSTEFSIERKVNNGRRILKAIGHQFPDVYLAEAWNIWHTADYMYDSGGLSDDGEIYDAKQISNKIDEAIRKANELVILYLDLQLEKHKQFFNGNYNSLCTDLSIIQADFDRESVYFKEIGIKCKDLKDKIEKILAGRKKEIEKLEAGKAEVTRDMATIVDLLSVLSDENKIALEGIVALAENRVKKFPADKEETINLVEATKELVLLVYEIECQVKNQREIKKNLQDNFEMSEKEIKSFNKEKRQALEFLQMGRQDMINQFATGRKTNEMIIAKDQAIIRYLEKTRKFFCK